MKKRNLILYVAVLAVIALVSCKKDYEANLNTQTVQQGINDKAYLRFFNANLNSARTYVYVDNVLASGTASTYGTLYPSTSPAVITVTPGNRSVTIKDTLLTTTQPVATASFNFEAGAYYTVFSYDTLNKAKAVIVKDNVVIPTDTTARVRFANFIYSATAVPNVDIWSTRRQANIFTNVALNGVTDFITFAAAAPVSDTLHVRETGKLVNIASLNGFNPIRKRSYTLVFRGRYQTTGTTGVARTLGSFLSY